jgi:exodeoxyribonuclease VII large subunit
LPVLIYPVPVQGQGAAQKIAAAIRLAGQRKECDVLILARGGGSLEDLWAFNEEIVARAVHECPLPIVTGIGHEVDFTIADFVADQRAPTPSAAAALVSPDQAGLSKSLATALQRLGLRFTGGMEQRRRMLEWLNKRLAQQHPGQRLRVQAQRLDELDQRLQRALLSQLRHGGARLAEFAARLHRHTPLPRLQRLYAESTILRRRLDTAVRVSAQTQRQRLAALMRALDAVSPLATLSRGYAIVQREPDQRLVKAAADVTPGQQVRARLAKGRLLCNVIKTYDE